MSARELAVAIAVIRGDPCDLAEVNVPVLLTTLRRHGLTVLFRRAIRASSSAIASDLDRALKDAHRDATRLLLVQERALSIIGEALASQQWQLWRGLHLARLLYDDPSERVGVDIDLLVPEHARQAAVRALEGHGFAARADARNATHELSLVGHGVGIDLHWHVLRPGRASHDLASWMLSRTITQNGVPVTDVTATLVMLLLHTALTEHVTGRLIRAVDIDRLLRRAAIDWPTALAVVGDAGLTAAAWATLTWTQTALATPVPDEVLAALAPGGLRRRYISAWLRHDPATMYPKLPLLVRGAFSLALHDDVRGATRAVVMLARARLAAIATMGRERHSQ